ncbi:MAG TPA: HAMP domain-containing sensor histidine kinase, partial [Candidatus Dormibacteraeota bacterium]|nr:HAMP domain-containing sensor histidine kinase [Candidatus Dormibacteraeota bacterium]
VEASQARQHAERMRELEHLKTEFMKLASHELRGPLTIIRGYLSMLADGSLADVDPVLPVLVSKADQMNLLLNQMLEVARLDEGGVRLALRRVDIRQLVSEAFEMLRPVATSKHTLTLRLGTQPLDVLADPTRVRDIVASLMDNAIKYSPDGGRVTCSVTSNEDAALVSITDQGVGIAPSEMPRLFTRFGRIVNEDNSQVDGSGMGLYVSREIALLHGGDLMASSQRRLGTTFRLTLPLAETLERRQPASARVPLPIGQYGFELANLQSNDMIRLGSALQRLAGEATDLEGAAGAITRHLYGQLIDTVAGRRSCALVRLYKTEPYALLRPEEAAFARAATGDPRPAPDMTCLTLLGSAGDLKDWNHPAASRAHRVIPLPSESAVAASPMVAQLLKQLGLDVGALVAPDASLLINANPGTHGVFYVPEAAGSPFIPAQEQFVIPHRIKSVVGFGGMLVNGEVLVVILFSKVAVPKASAAMFRVLTHGLLRSFEPLLTRQRT